MSETTPLKTKIFRDVITLMKGLERIKGMTGEERKQSVLIQMRRVLKDQLNDDCLVECALSLVSEAIDTIIDIAKKNIDLKELSKKTKKCISPICY